MNGLSLSLSLSLSVYDDSLKWIWFIQIETIKQTTIAFKSNLCGGENENCFFLFPFKWNGFTFFSPFFALLSLSYNYPILYFSCEKKMSDSSFFFMEIGNLSKIKQSNCLSHSSCARVPTPTKQRNQQTHYIALHYIIIISNWIIEKFCFLFAHKKNLWRIYHSNSLYSALLLIIDHP